MPYIAMKISERLALGATRVPIAPVAVRRIQRPFRPDGLGLSASATPRATPTPKTESDRCCRDTDLTLSGRLLSSRGATASLQGLVHPLSLQAYLPVSRLRAPLPWDR
jgi:hypothetical protein